MIQVSTQETEAATRTRREQTGTLSLWERILGLIEQDLAERRNERFFVDVRDGESGSTCEKEIGDLSAHERRSLPPVLKEHVSDRLIERYVAGQGRVDLLERRRACTKKIEDLSPEDLPALIEAERQRAEEEHRKERERAELAQVAWAELELLPVLAIAG